MAEPTFDADGYPTEETLLAIKHWNERDPRGWLEFVNKAWDKLVGSVNAEVRTKDQQITTVSFCTGGWSGHEALIAAMRDNYVLWARLWESSHRGGRHVFRVPE